MGILKKMKDENEESFLVTSASLNVELFYFNMNVQSYEPVLEPWTLTLSQNQIERYLPLETTISSHQMLNMNVTFALMKVITNLQKRLTQSVEDWEVEDKKDDEFRAS